MYRFCEATTHTYEAILGRNRFGACRICSKLFWWSLCVVLILLLSPALAKTDEPVTAKSAPPALKHPTGSPPEKFELNKQIFFNNRAITARVSVVQLKIGNNVKPAWCYQTYGMGELKHPELFILVLKKSGEADQAFPHGPVKILGGLATSRPSESYNELDATAHPCFPELPKFAGALFVPYDQLTGPKVPSDSLAVVAVTAEELEVAKIAGPTRVKAALAQQATYYPCPIWCDRDRAGVFSSADVAYMKADPTIMHLNSVGTYASVLLRNNEEFSLRLSKSEGKLLAKSLERTKGQLRMNLCFDPRAGAFIVWPPQGAKSTTAVGPPQPDGSRISGSFLALVGGAKTNEVKQIIDGFFLQLTEENTKQLIDKLANGGDYVANLSASAKRFSLSWINEHYLNPIDGKDYQPKKGWTTYSPSGESTDTRPPTTSGKSVDVNHIVLLTPEDLLARAVSVETLSEYIKLLEKAAIAELSKMHPKTKQTVTVQCDLSPGSIAEFKVAVEPPAGMDPVLKNLYSALNAVSAVGVRYKIAFQLVIDVPAQ